MRRGRWCALALAVALPIAISPTHASDGVSDPVAGADVERLADLMVGEQQVTEAAAGNFDAAFDAKLKARPAGAPVPEAGLIAAIRSAGRAETLAILHAGYPELRSIVTTRLKAELTPTEIADATAFYASPTGRKIGRAALASARGADAAAIQQSMMAGAVGALDAGDTPALMAFGATSVARKLQSLGPQLQQASADWAGRVLAANGARLQQSVQHTVQSYAAAHSGTRSAK